MIKHPMSGLAILAVFCWSTAAWPAELPPPIDEQAVLAQSSSVPDEVVADWLLQDGVESLGDYRGALGAILKETGDCAKSCRERFLKLNHDGTPDSSWKELYRDACLVRRAVRLRTLVARVPQMIFTKHYDLGGSHYAYTEGLSDAQAERQFVPGSALCRLTVNGTSGSVQTLLEHAEGVIRDPDVSYDGKRVLFAWKKSLDADDYHLYELDLETRNVRQITFGLGFADYEGIYTPNGQIIFNSTRCVQTVDCWWTEVSNLYTCDLEGRYLRRLTFDQVHTNFPTVMPDGRIIYTRWDYNDRGQIFPQGLFQMNGDGTGQSQFYGNNSWFPTTILHARGIPGTQNLIAILTGHHTIQKGWLATIAPSRGRQENEGTQLVAPVRDTDAVRIDQYAQDGDQFQYPYPVDESQFLAACKPKGSQRPFGIYWVDVQGRRELLASDTRISCNQPIPLRPRPVETVRPNLVDHRQRTGTYYIQDIYHGDGLRGVPRGTVKRLRVVALDFRAAGIGENRSHGEAGGALSSTPISIGNGAWDPKTILGEATVHADGSALFTVPAKTPVYFQALDEKGYMVQTMRSWSTAQPGETLSCAGCHESQNTSVPSTTMSMALRAGAETIPADSAPREGFSFSREIQPILDRHCVSCHDQPSIADAVVAKTKDPNSKHSFSLRSNEVADTVAKRRWSESYLALTHSRASKEVGGVDMFLGRPTSKVNWISVQSAPPMRSAYSAGSSRSEWLALLENGHEGVTLTRQELAKIACWIDLAVPFCGDYREANLWSQEEIDRYNHFLEKRRTMQDLENANIRELLDGSR
jgi:hypothetical protein